MNPFKQILKYLTPALLFVVFAFYFFQGSTLIFWLLTGAFILSLAAQIYFSIQEGTQKTKKNLSSVLYFFLVLSLAVIVYLLFLKYPVSFDMTSAKRYTLTPKSEEVVKNLSFDVKIVVFQDDNTPDFGGQTGSMIYDNLKNTLEMYKRLNPRITVEFLNPEKDKLRIKSYEQLKKMRVNIGDLVIETPSGKRYIEKQELAKWTFRQDQFGQPNRVIEAFLSEEKVTSALISLMETGKSVILWLTGDGEVDIDESQESAFFIKQELENNNFEVKKISSFEKFEGNGDLLVIAGPSKTIPKETIAGIEEFLKKGKILIFMKDPSLDEISSGLETFLKEKYGIEPVNQIVVDLKHAYQSPINIIPEVENHPLTDFLRSQNLGLVFSLSSYFNITDKAVSLIKNYPGAWAEKDLKKIKQTGQIDVANAPKTDAKMVIAALSENKEDKSKVLALGDSDFIRNQMTALGGNKDFFINSVNYLLNKKAPLSISKPLEQPRQMKMLSDGEKKFYFFVFVIFLPLLVIVMGILVFMKRKKLRNFGASK